MRRNCCPHSQGPVAIEDILIGATALSRGMTLATRNTSHFKRLGVSMVRPFA